MKYKSLYRDLANTLSSLGCFISDFDILGHCMHTDKTKAFIFIKPTMSYKHKYFVLAHEAGHLFFIKKNKVFNWTTKPRTEEEANSFAFHLFSLKDIDCNEYRKFYEKAKKKAKKRKKAWFEI